MSTTRTMFLLLAASVALMACDGDGAGAADGLTDGGTVDQTGGDIGRGDGPAADAGPTEPDGTGPVDECTADEARCVDGDNALQRCESAPSGASWGAAEPCAAGTYCRAGVGACQPPTATQQQQATWLEAMIDHLADTIGWIADLGVDVAAVKQQMRLVLFGGDGGDGAYYAAAWRAVIGFPVGHVGMWSSTRCGSAELPYQSSSRLGACARPYKDHFVVTHAVAGNPLGLAAGDRITAVEGLTGDALVDEIYRRPVCGNAAASEANRRIAAATSLLGVLRKGEELQVVAPDGAARKVKVSALAASPIGCRDPFGRDTSKVIETTLRPDGVGVVRLTRLVPAGGFKGQGYDEVMAEIEAFKQELAGEVAKLAGAKALIWDLRANGGGATPVGLSIIGGMPGVKDKTFVARCRSRIPGTLPPLFYGGQSDFDYVVEADPTFPQPDKVAVLIDGLSISAADYFAHAVRLATSVPLVGSATAGAFGGGGGPELVSKQPELTVQSDPARCADDKDVALEGRAVEPTHPVEYDPQALAQGKDPVLEAALSLLAP